MAATTVTAVPLAGRDADLDRLRRHLDRGGVVLVVGAPGIGKTRLVRAALAELADRATVLSGGAPALSSDLAFAPIVEALGPFLRGLDRRRQAALLADLPDLARLFPDLGAAPPTGDPGLDRMRLFDAIARLLALLAADRPVVLAIDDLHRADPSTLQLVDYVSRGLSGSPVTVLATVRDVADDQEPAFRALRNSLAGAGRSADVQLERLDPAAVAAMAHDLLGGEPPAELLRLLDDRAAGIPLFAATLVTGLIESGALVPTALGWSLSPAAATTVPRLVRDLLSERMDGLERSARRVLELIAVHGEALDHDLLAAAAGLEENELVAAVRRLRLAGLVAETATDHPGYTAAHPLMAEVADAELTETERRARHRSLAGAFEGLRPDQISRLARHYRGAGREVPDPDRALAVLLQAAAVAAAPDDAARHLRAALLLADGGRRAEIVGRLAIAERRAGRIDVAIELWSEMGPDPEVERQIALAEWDLGRLEAASQRIDAALADPGPAAAALYETRADFADRMGDLPVLERTVDALQLLATGDADVRVMVAAALAEVALHHRRGDIGRCREAADRAVSAAETSDDLPLQLRACEVALNLAAEYGEPARLRRLASRALELAELVGGPPSILRAHGCLMVAAYLGGEWDEANREGEIALGVSRRSGIVRGVARSLAMQGLMLAQQGHSHEAAVPIQESRAALAEIGGDAHVATTLALAEAYIAIEAGDIQRGLGLRPQLEDPAGSLLARRLSALGELQALGGDIAAARETAARIATTDEADPYIDGIRRWVLARADDVDGDLPGAADQLRATVDVFDAVGARFEASRSRLALAALARDPAPALEALTAFEAMGGARWVDRCRGVLRDLGVRVDRPKAAAASAGGLSGRELEVARLAAQGLTNAEIAARLVISPRTASTHLQKIYRRLDVSSRAALTKRMLEDGLL